LRLRSTEDAGDAGDAGDADEWRAKRSKQLLLIDICEGYISSCVLEENTRIQIHREGALIVALATDCAPNSEILSCSKLTVAL
jgi:hypothetical protein